MRNSRMLLDAKRLLYSALLQCTPGELSGRESIMLSYLANDPQIQEFLAGKECAK